MKRRIGFVWIALFAASLLPRPAAAAFHLMQIDQAIGGVGNDTSAQAVQLSMRAIGNNLLGGNAKLFVRDATGNNPILITDFLPLANPANNGACRQILIASSAFLAKTTPATTADYTMKNLIPASYLAGGTLTFENATGIVLWRLSWGAYSGPGTSDGTNSPGDLDANPPAAGALPSASNRALKFNPACGTAYSSNDLQYSLTGSGAVVVNNALGSFTVVAAPAVPALPGVSKLLLPVLLAAGVLAFAFLRRRAA